MNDQTKALEKMTAEELRTEVEHAQRRAYELEMRLTAHLAQEARREREMAAVIRGREWRQVQLHGEREAHHRAAELLRPIEGVLYRIEQLGDRAGVKQVAELKTAVRNARHTLTLYAKPAPPTFDSSPRQETNRLRDYILQRGRAIHREQGTDRPDEMCRCQGCELIRQMDVGAPSVEEAIHQVRGTPAEPAA